jgi:hypothetical protein
MNLQIDTTYTAVTTAQIEIPVDAWDEIAEWYVKWDVFHYKTKDLIWHESIMNSRSSDIIDWKRPSSVGIQSADADWNPEDTLV